MKRYKASKWYILAIVCLVALVIKAFSTTGEGAEGAGWGGLVLAVVLIPAVLLVWLADYLIHRKTMRDLEKKPAAPDPNFNRNRIIVIVCLVLVLIFGFIAES